MNDLFIKINLDLFKDKQLNIYERVVLSYIQGFPNGYFSTKTFMADTLGMSRESVSRILSRLIEKGYIFKSINDNGVEVYTVIENHTTVIENHADRDLKSHYRDAKSHQRDLKSHKYNNYIDNNNISDKIVIVGETETENETEKTLTEKPSLIEVLQFFVDNDLRGSGQAFYQYYSTYEFVYQGKLIDWKAKAKEWSAKEKKKSSYNISEIELRALTDDLIYKGSD